ncbi:hypothetical protein JZ785_27305 [Alicyclobacillus curvatus]|nr:hypothetical protein JZ785_27305 [Alicyclobacillus curvatus]
MARQYVIGNNGTVYVRVDDASSQFGFYLADHDETYDGGVGTGDSEWEAIEFRDPRISSADHDRLDWLLGE